MIGINANHNLELFMLILQLFVNFLFAINGVRYRLYAL